jgi:hypothetical protein
MELAVSIILLILSVMLITKDTFIFSQEGSRVCMFVSCFIAMAAAAVGFHNFIAIVFGA